jgi:hypothetical protein
MKPIPQVGQTLYSLNVGNMARNVKQELTPVIVRKVGRKYFDCSSERSPNYVKRYHLDSWKEKTEYSVDSMLYADPQEWSDEKEAGDITSMVRKTFDSRTGTAVPLAKLRQIRDILKS